MIKICTKCGEFKAYFDFHTCKRAKGGLRSHCKICAAKSHKEYQLTPEGKAAQNKAYNKYRSTIKGKATLAKHHNRNRSTIKGYLCSRYHRLYYRCNNPKCNVYNYYGGRGIKCLFKNGEAFIDYVINVCGLDTLDKIKSKDIHRIDNDGNYEPGNLEFLLPQEHKAKHRELRKAVCL